MIPVRDLAATVISQALGPAAIVPETAKVLAQDLLPITAATVMKATVRHGTAAIPAGLFRKNLRRRLLAHLMRLILLREIRTNPRILKSMGLHRLKARLHR